MLLDGNGDLSRTPPERTARIALLAHLLRSPSLRSAREPTGSVPVDTAVRSRAPIYALAGMVALTVALVFVMVVKPELI